jgi:FMN phosphatase YigB (HAD superfamily)
VLAVAELPEVRRAEAERDLSAAAHRAADMAWLAAAGVDAELADAIYAEQLEAGAWAPYPDARIVLTALRRRGARAGVVSDVGRDIRRHFAATDCSTSSRPSSSRSSTDA